MEIEFDYDNPGYRRVDGVVRFPAISLEKLKQATILARERGVLLHLLRVLQSSDEITLTVPGEGIHGLFGGGPSILLKAADHPRVVAAARACAEIDLAEVERQLREIGIDVVGA